MSYDKTGKVLGIGDKAGRLILFEQFQPKSSRRKPEFQYLTELQSHTREFDYLKSTDIEEKINQIIFMRQ